MITTGFVVPLTVLTVSTFGGSSLVGLSLTLINKGRRTTDWHKDPTIIKDWNMLGWKIDHCLVHEVPLQDKCSVNYSLEIMIGTRTIFSLRT
jgi:hypothetical protein